MVDKELQKYFDFDEADLFANRSGVLTGKQRKRLEGETQFAGKAFLIAGIVILGIAILPSTILFFVKVPVSFLVIWSIIWIPVWGFVGITVIRMGSPKKTDFDLKCVEGKVNIIREDNYNVTTKRNETDYELHIGKVAFDVDGDLADIMIQGDAYTIYYIEGTKDILSAEKMKSER